MPMAATPPPDAELAALRQAGLHRHDPLRWHFIEALARRSAACEGATQAHLQARLTTLLADYRRAAEQAAHGGAGSSDEPARSGSEREPAIDRPRPLAALLDHIGRQAPAAAELKTLQRFRRTWSRLAADQRVVRSRTRLPEQAGPMNSQRLVHRALTLMRDLSPDYLDHFVAHVDTLLWLERASGGDLLAKKDVLQAAAPRKARRRT